MKDYYKILEIEPSATLSDIKKAFRRKALLHHPDKNQNTTIGSIQYDLIREAYETLTNQDLKERYLQQRWLYKAYNQTSTQAIVTPDDVLSSLLSFYRKNYYTDYYRADKSGLLEQLEQILNEKNVSLLTHCKEPALNHDVVSLGAQAIEVLSPADRIKMARLLEKINTGEPNSTLLLQKIKAAKKEINWARYRFWVVAFLIVVFCWLIWFVGKH